MRALVLLVILAIGGWYLLSPYGRALLDGLRINWTRWENQSHYRSGQPLPGTPDLARLDERLAAKGVSLGVPIYLRIFKLDSELELWVEKDGHFVRFATYPICLWSGRLGPKLKEGDKQAPEGFYTVASEQLNPNSRMYRSFSLGFPNAYDRAHGRTGSFLMVHGGCASVGCYAVTELNLAARRGDKWESFWADLKKGYDMFEASRVPPVVSVCNGHYVFEPGTAASAGGAIEERCPPEVAGNS
jgi:murein L,D-transpeptidase YafK